MIKSYLYNRVSTLSWLRGLFPIYSRKALIDPITLAGTKKMVWRNQYTDTIKITNAYKENPLELSNLLFLRTREREMMHNRLHKTSDTVKFKNFYTTGSDSKIMGEIESELFNGFDHLKEMLAILEKKKDFDLPVAFASNVIYACEKNGLRNEEMYEKILFPILKKKAQYLHADGIAGTLWALGQYNSKNSDLVAELLKHYEDKKFATDLVYVNNAKLSTESFVTAEGTHGTERESTDEFKNMYFKDHISCLELYDGLKSLSSQSLDSDASKKINEALSNLESRYEITSDSFSYYKQVTESGSSPSTT